MALTDRDYAPPQTADEALARLEAGNLRFVRGEARFPTVQKEVLAELTRGQQPYATILGCSDSRVPPELVFDAGFGVCIRQAQREVHACAGGAWSGN